MSPSLELRQHLIFPDTSREEHSATHILDELIADLVRSENAKRQEETDYHRRGRIFLLRLLAGLSVEGLEGFACQ